MTDEIEPSAGDVVTANVTDEVLRIVAKAGDKAAPRTILDEARDPSSPLHGCFTWDDGEAAERYRLAQAGALYRKVKLTVLRLDAEQRVVKFEAVRAVTSVPMDRKRKESASYGRTADVMSDAQRRESVLRGIVRELAALRQKYLTYKELHDVWVVIDDAVATYETQPKKKGRGDASQAVAA
jgi:hypothetical protein